MLILKYIIITLIKLIIAKFYVLMNREERKMNEYSRISLLESILIDSNCSSLSELSALTKEQRMKIATHIKKDIPPEVPTLQDYNEALHYLLCHAPAETKEIARNCLLNGLVDEAGPLS